MTPRHCLATLLLSLSLSPYATGFFVQPMTQKMNVQRQQRALLATSRSAARSPESDDVTSRVTKMVTPSSKSGGTLRSTLAAAALCTVLATTALPTAPAAAAAYDDSLDAASQTIEQVLTSLNEAAGDSDRTFAVYERINGIITEGAGVGGNINYKGIQLDRGYISDEDTSIYNPGLTLLTESEKESITAGVIASKQACVQQNTWNENDQSAFAFLRTKLDPYHTYELSGYFKILPIYAAAVYLAVLAVQQSARGIFPIAYGAGVAAIVAPALLLIVFGP